MSVSTTTAFQFVSDVRYFRPFPSCCPKPLFQREAECEGSNHNDDDGDDDDNDDNDRFLKIQFPFFEALK